MTDDTNPQDDDVGALLRRGDGPVTVRPLRLPPPRGRPAPSFVAAGALVVALAIAGGAISRQPRGEPAATSSPSLAATPAGAATAAPTAASMTLDPSLALVVNLGGHGIGVRSETDAAVIFRVDNRTQYAVSPKGQLAYWKTGPDDALPHELHVFDLASRADRRILTLTDERAGAAGFMAWSTDGGGLAFATHSAASAYEGRWAPSRPQVSTWRLLDLATGTARSIGSINGAWLVPLSWDRASGLATATEIGRETNGSTASYYAYSDAARGIVQLPLPGAMEPLGIHVNSSGDTGVGIERTGCGSGAVCRSTVWTWALDDPSLRQRHDVLDGLALDVKFRPGTRDVYLVHRVSDTRAQLESWGDSARRPSREILASTTPPAGFYFRGDGSAIVTGTFLPSQAGSLVDPDARSSAVPIALPDDVIAMLGGGPTRPGARPASPPSGLVYGTNDGRLAFALENGNPTGPSGKVCDGRVARIATQAGSVSAVVVCELATSGSDRFRGFLVDLGSFVAPSVAKVTPLPGPMDTNLALSPDSRSVIYTAPGSCTPPAPICRTRAFTLDVGGGHIGTPIEVMPQEYNLGEVRWTALGPSIFKPQTSDNGTRSPEQAGTFLYDGSRWRRYSLHRIIDVVPGLGTLLEIEGGQGVVMRSDSREDRLSPPGVGERALALLDDGRVLAWRPGGAAFEGTVVTYRGAGVTDGADAGHFSPWTVLRAGPLANAMLGLELSGAAGPNLTVNVYSVADHTFVAVNAAGASAVGALTIRPVHR